MMNQQETLHRNSMQMCISSEWKMDFFIENRTQHSREHRERNIAITYKYQLN